MILVKVIRNYITMIGDIKNYFYKNNNRMFPRLKEGVVSNSDEIFRLMDLYDKFIKLKN